jgi:hypothetical protein
MRGVCICGNMVFVCIPTLAADESCSAPLVPAVWSVVRNIFDLQR